MHVHPPPLAETGVVPIGSEPASTTSPMLGAPPMLRTMTWNVAPCCPAAMVPLCDKETVKFGAPVLAIGSRAVLLARLSSPPPDTTATCSPDAAPASTD